MWGADVNQSMLDDFYEHRVIQVIKLDGSFADPPANFVMLFPGVVAEAAEGEQAACPRLGARRSGLMS